MWVRTILQNGRAYFFVTSSRTIIGHCCACPDEELQRRNPGSHSCTKYLYGAFIEVAIVREDTNHGEVGSHAQARSIVINKSGDALCLKMGDDIACRNVIV